MESRFDGEGYRENGFGGRRSDGPSTRYVAFVKTLRIANDFSSPLDYEGVGTSSRDANSKKAAAEATAIFQNYYPEFLVRVASPAFLFISLNFGRSV